MKTSKVTLLILVLVFALFADDTSATNAWLENYLTGMDQLMMLPWRYIFFYTWLILPQWGLCTFFYSMGTDLIPNVTATSSEELQIQNCKDGVKFYFDAMYYPGGPDFGEYPYFRSFKK